MITPIIILVEPSHPGNIGAVARAMKTMGHHSLRLVNPKQFPDMTATRRAAGAEDVLTQATCYSNLDDALSDCHIALATSNRPRTLQWPVYTPEEAAAYCSNYQNQSIALVFGRESNGLNNEELNRCHGQITIPTYSPYHSLNLSHAVQILTYCFAQSKTEALTTSPTLAPHESLNHLYQHFENTLKTLPHFNMPHPEHTLNRLRCLINRAHPTENEVNLLRGILSAVDHHCMED